MASSQFFDALFSRQGMRRRYPHDELSLRVYLQELRSIPLLTAEEEKTLAVRAGNGERDAIEQLVRANLRLVVVIASYFRDRGLPLTDLIQAGNSGLLEAARRFDPQRGARFATFAKFWILQGIDHALTDQARAIRTPYNVAQLDRRIQKVVEEYLNQGVEPSLETIASCVGQPVEVVTEHLILMQEPLSIDQESNSEVGALADTLAGPPPGGTSIPDPPVFWQDALQSIERALSELERDVIKWRFGLDDGICYTHSEIAKLLGRTSPRAGEHIKAIEKRALLRLRAVLGERGA